MENNISLIEKNSWDFTSILKQLFSSRCLNPEITQLKLLNGNIIYIYSCGEIKKGNTYDYYSDIDLTNYVGKIKI